MSYEITAQTIERAEDIVLRFEKLPLDDYNKRALQVAVVVLAEVRLAAWRAVSDPQDKEQILERLWRNLIFKPNADSVAKVFCRLMRAALTPEQLVEVNDRNEKERNCKVCHSHDFIDANEVMMAAFAELGLDSDQILHDDHLTDLWNHAWTIAVICDFAADLPL